MFYHHFQHKCPDIEPENLNKCLIYSYEEPESSVGWSSVLGTMDRDMAVAGYSLNLPVLFLDLDDITRLSVRNKMTTKYINLDDITRLGYVMSTVITRIVYVDNIPQCQE